MKESDLYLPVKHYLAAQGYEVKGEVHDCDVVGVRGEELPVVVELKLNLNLDVLLQAVDRLSLTPKVYVGVPRRCGILRRRRKPVLKMLRMLGLGLLRIDPTPARGNATSASGAVEVLLDPGEYRPRQSKFRRERLLGEFEKRVGDPNLGGAASRRGVMTAYRQRALEIARFLRAEGPTKASLVAKTLSEPKARDILYRNVYGWFENVSRGVYGLSPRGEREIEAWPPGAESAKNPESEG